MMIGWVRGQFLAGTVAAACTLLVALQPPVRAALPAGDFRSAYYHYNRPDDLVVEESTPTPDQLRFRGRPALLANLKYLPQPGPAAKPATIDEVDIRRLLFRDADGDLVPALLCTPKAAAGPLPLAVAIHGLGSNKAQVCGQIAPALIKRGFAILAPDMPLHGERPGDARKIWADKRWLTAMQLHRRAIIDIRQCIDLAETRPELDLSKGVILAGYSMGSWLDSVAGPLDPRVKAMVLMVGGATDATSQLRQIPLLSLVDPLQAIGAFAGRPLLMLNAHNDRIVTPEMARRLYEAAPEPKEQRWYDSGHRLPTGAYEDAAAWIAKTWATITVPATQPATP